MPPGPPGTAGFTVTTTQDTIRVNYAGSPVQGDTLGYTTTSGYHGTVWLPRPDSGDPVKVAAAVTADLRAVLTALTISGTVRR